VYSLREPAGLAQSDFLSDSVLPGYRAAVGDLAAEVTGHPAAADTAVVADLVAKRLGEPELQAVLARLDGGADATAARLADEVRAFRPNAYNSASDLATFTRILLLSQIDAPRCCGSGTGHSRPGCPDAPGTGSSTASCRPTARAWPGCGSPARARSSSPS
jgi:hypothetical protein